MAEAVRTQSSQCEIDSRWEYYLQQLDLAGAVLLADSEAEPWRRTYRDDASGAIIKIHLLNRELAAYGDLAGEYEILDGLPRNLPVPCPIAFCDCQGARAAYYEAIDGTPLSELKCNFRETVACLLRLMLILIRLSYHGIAHNDLQARNILIKDRTREVVLLDFDRATHESRLNALLRNFFKRKRQCDCTFWASFGQLALISMLPFTPKIVLRGVQLFTRLT